MAMLDSKREWRAHMAQVHALPRDYQVVYQAIQKYLFKVATISGQANLVPALEELLALFADGAARDLDVLAVTGSDVGAFADGLFGA